MRADIEAILLAELDGARAQESSATERYWKVLSQLTHHDPSADELDHLCEAGRSKLAARQALWAALAKLDDYRAQGAGPAAALAA